MCLAFPFFAFPAFPFQMSGIFSLPHAKKDGKDMGFSPFRQKRKEPFFHISAFEFLAIPGTSFLDRILDMSGSAAAAFVSSSDQSELDAKIKCNEFCLGWVCVPT